MSDYSISLLRRFVDAFPEHPSEGEARQYGHNSQRQRLIRIISTELKDALKTPAETPETP